MIADPRRDPTPSRRGNGRLDDNPLRGAPHTAADLMADTWDRPYTRAQAAYPGAGPAEDKYWPPVGRIDGVYGDRNLVCSCPPLEAYAGE